MKCEKCRKEFKPPNHGVNNQNKYKKEMLCFDCYVKRLDKNVKKTKK